MSIRKPLVAFILVVATGLSAAGARAGSVELTLGAGAGYGTFDGSFGVDDGIPFDGRVGLIFSRYFGLEGTYGKVLASSSRSPARAFPLDHYGVDIVLNLSPSAKVSPYIFGGWAELDLDIDIDNAPGTRIDMSGVEFGGGVKIALIRIRGSRIDLRLDGRNIMVKNDSPLLKQGDLTHHQYVTGGIEVGLFGGQKKDADRDGVTDGNDDCPDTPLGAVVDSRGCPLDIDGDGVYDGLDLCADTPVGAMVDLRGCPQDSDGDGVFNGLDQCEGTLEGAHVDKQGCATDKDGDGVADGLDGCAGTPRGVLVDELGCPKDSDGDGVFDGLDRCEGTPAGVRVDAAGCPVPVSEMEEELVGTGVMQLQEIYFETGKATLELRSNQALLAVADILVRWPSLKIEIGGHTDSVGSNQLNLELSRSRARSVLNWLLENFETLRFDQFFVHGYGESQPVASNDTAEGRAKNRRVEFRVLNREGLPRKR